MGNRAILLIAAVVAAVAVGGVGFASYSASASITANGSVGTFYLTTSIALTSSSLSSASGACTPVTSTSVSASNLLPGDYCQYTVTVNDPGSIAGTLSAPTSALTSGPGVQLSITLGALSGTAVGPGGASPQTFTITITDTSLTATTSESDVWTVTITGTAV